MRAKPSSAFCYISAGVLVLVFYIAVRITVLMEKSPLQYFLETCKRSERADSLPKHITLVGYPDKSTCTTPLCKLSKTKAPTMRLPHKNQTCAHVQDCVTVLVMTSQRLDLVARLIETVQQKYPKMPCVVIDMFATDLKKQAAWQKTYKKYEKLTTYSQLKKGDSFGRHQGSLLFRTRYVLYVDASVVFTQETKLEYLIKILEYSEISIVGGSVNDEHNINGLVRFHPAPGEKKSGDLTIYKNMVYQSVTCFGDCYVTDIVTSFFMGKLQDILNGGAWDNEIGNFEFHQSLLNAWRKGLYIGHCTSVKVKREVPTKVEKLAVERFVTDYVSNLVKIGNFRSVKICGDKNSYKDNGVCGNFLKT